MGPYDSAKAFEILNNKLGAKLISPDSFVTDGKNYGEKVWTAGSFDMTDLEKLSNNGTAEYDQNYTFDLNQDILDPSPSNNLLFSNLEELEPLEKAQFFESKLSDFYKKPFNQLCSLMVFMILRSMDNTVLALEKRLMSGKLKMLTKQLVF